MTFTILSELGSSWSDIKIFDVDFMVKKENYFREIREWLNKQELTICEIECCDLIISDVGRFEIIIKKINPPGPPLAAIYIFNYQKNFYKNYSEYDYRGIIIMFTEEIIYKLDLPYGGTR